jgi:hypothetical protein
MMLNELCMELKNYFDKAQPKIFGEIIIRDSKIQNAEFLRAIKPNQYFRIAGSVFNDGVYRYDEELVLEDETFKGSVWLMAVPKAVIELANDIEKWVNDYSNVNSPYQSESFGGYSYSKASGTNGGAITWQDAFSKRLNMYRRIRL